MPGLMLKFIHILTLELVTYWAKPISEWMTENNLTHLNIFYSLLLFSFSWNEYRSLRVSSSLQHIVLLRVPRCHLYISHFVTLIMFNHFFITPTLLHSEGWIILLSPHLYLVATNISDHSFTTQWHLHSSLRHQEKVFIQWFILQRTILIKVRISCFQLICYISEM